MSLLFLTGCAADSTAAEDPTAPSTTAPPSYVTVDATPSATSAAVLPQTTQAPVASSPAASPTTTASTPVLATPTSEPSAQLTPQTSATTAETSAAAFDPATLPDVPAPDPEAPGDESKRPCPSAANYYDEDPSGLDQNVVTAWRAVEAAANAEGLLVCLNDGKRSRAQQEATYQEYVQQYGQEMADQYVLPPEKSAHVAGFAIDVQPAAAFNWLEKTNGKFGFCRTYDNEAWHFEFDRSFAASGCPARQPAPVA